MPTPTKFRASSFPALGECGCFKSKPYNTKFTAAGTARHEALQAAIESNDRSKLEALPTIEDREGVEYAIDYINLHTSTDHEMEWEKPTKIECNGVTITGRWDLVQVERDDSGKAVFGKGFDLKNMLMEDKDYKNQFAVYAAAVMLRDSLSQLEYHAIYAHPKKAHVHTFTFSEAEKIIEDVVENALKGEATPCPYCGWCDLSSSCPALNETAVSVGKSLKQELAEYDPKNLADPVNLSRALKFANTIEPWINEVKKLAKEHLLGGGHLQGYTLKSRKLPDKVSDLNQAFQNSGLTAEQFMQCCTLRLTQLYEAYASAFGVTKAQAKRECQTRLLPVLLQTEYTQVLTPQK